MKNDLFYLNFWKSVKWYYYSSEHTYLSFHYSTFPTLSRDHLSVKFLSFLLQRKLPPSCGNPYNAATVDWPKAKGAHFTYFDGIVAGTFTLQTASFTESTTSICWYLHFSYMIRWTDPFQVHRSANMTNQQIIIPSSMILIWWGTKSLV